MEEGEKEFTIYMMSWKVQFAFLSKEEKVKLYTVMTNSEKTPVAHRDICSHSDIHVTDMLM